jgi:hypothetical protein
VVWADYQIFASQDLARINVRFMHKRGLSGRDTLCWRLWLMRYREVAIGQGSDASIVLGFRNLQRNVVLHQAPNSRC